MLKEGGGEQPVEEDGHQTAEEGQEEVTSSGISLEPLVRLAEHDELVSTLAKDMAGNLLATGSWDRQ